MANTADIELEQLKNAAIRLNARLNQLKREGKINPYGSWGKITDLSLVFEINNIQLKIALMKLYGCPLTEVQAVRSTVDDLLAEFDRRDKEGWTFFGRLWRKANRRG